MAGKGFVHMPGAMPGAFQRPGKSIQVPPSQVHGSGNTGGGKSVAGGGFNRYSAGNKHYGGGRPMPTMGRVDPQGYEERDALTKAKRNALLRRMQAGMGKKYFSAEWLRGNKHAG